jgi:hypothetical protein
MDTYRIHVTYGAIEHYLTYKTDKTLSELQYMIHIETSDNTAFYLFESCNDATNKVYGLNLSRADAINIYQVNTNE